jgi:hypothetical protein
LPRAVIARSSESATSAESRQTNVPFVDTSSCRTINRACAHATPCVLYSARAAMTTGRRFARCAKNAAGAVTSNNAEIVEHHCARVTKRATKGATCTIVKSVKVTLVKSVKITNRAIIDVPRRRRNKIYVSRGSGRRGIVSLPRYFHGLNLI